jgi:hypothetical protein
MALNTLRPSTRTDDPEAIRPAARPRAEGAAPNLVHLNTVDRGGHVAARELPELPSEGIHATFRSLR